MHVGCSTNLLLLGSTMDMRAGPVYDDNLIPAISRQVGPEATQYHQ